MSAIILDREIVHYEVLGRGRPLVMLHGWVGSWRYWIPVMQAASISFRAYAVDLYGFGDSSKKPDRYTMDAQVKLLSGFMEEMGILKAGLVGHGLGAMVALKFAAQHPEMVDRVMAVSFPLADTSLNSRLRSNPPAALADWLLGRTPVTEPARLDAPKTDPAAINESLADLDRIRFNTMWSPSSPACLLVYGENDPMVLPPEPDQAAAFPEKTHTILFENCGHFPMLDEGSKFNRLLLDFLNLPSGETPRILQLKEEWKRRVR